MPTSKPTQSPPNAATSIRLQALLYSVSRRTITAWRQRMAPLENPSAMPTWWGRAFPGKMINPGIHRALATNSRKRGTGGKNASDPATAGRPELNLPPPPPLKVGFEHTYRRACTEEMKLHGRLRALELASAEARKDGNRTEADALQAEADAMLPLWMKLSRVVGHSDTRQIRNALQRGDLIRRDSIEAEYSSLMRVLPEVMREDLKEMRTELEPLPPQELWDAKVDSILDEMFKNMPPRLTTNLSPAVLAGKF